MKAVGKLKKLTKKINFNVDKILIRLCIISFAIVTASQIGLKIPAVKGIFTDIEVFEGTAVGEDKDAINSGTVTLELLEGEPKNELEIMVNGEKVDVFDKKIKEVELLSTSVVELKSLSNEKYTVRIAGMTGDLKLATAKNDIMVKKGINFVGRLILAN